MQSRYLPTPCLCLVTDRRLCGGVDMLEKKVISALSGGVDMVQIREKDLPSDEFMQLASRLRSATGGKALLVINDRADVTMAIEADGLHLPENSISVCDAKIRMPTQILISKAVHDTDGAFLAAREGAEFLILGTIFPTASKPGINTGGVNLISAVTHHVDIPVLAIGGIDSSNAASVIVAGASGVAVITAILGAPNAEKAAQDLKRSMEITWEG